MNPFDPDIFAVGTPCLPCCSQVLSCGTECVRVGTEYTFAPPGICVTTAIDDTVCIAYYLPEAADGCGPTVITPTIRAACSGLTIGISYTVTVHLISNILTTTTLTWTFTATGTSENTSYQSFPTPDATDSTWEIDSNFAACSITVTP